MPSTLIARDASSASSNDTDAAPWTISETSPGDLDRDRRIEAQALVRDVARDRAHAIEVRLGGAERARERLAQPLQRVRVVARAHEHVDVRSVSCR